MKWPRMITTSLAVLAITSALSAQSSALDEGIQLIREGNFDLALIKLEQAHRLKPRDATIDNLLGITESQLGNLDKARADYRNAIRHDPSKAAPHRNLGFNLLTVKDNAGAEPELREASRLDPSDKFAHYYLLLLALATGHDAEAAEQASHAGQLLDNDPEAVAVLVKAEIRMGHLDEAAGRIERLEEANQIATTTEYQIATLLSQHGFYSQAIHCFTRIAFLDPSWQNRYNLALALLYGGQFPEASTLLATLHTEQPANADILTYRGSALESQQKMPEALEAYRAASAADPSNPDRTLDYTRLLMILDRYDEAIQVVHHGMGETYATAPLELRLGAVQMLKANFPAARDAFDAALATDPNLDVAYVGLAETYVRQDNNAEALRILEAERFKLPNDYLLEYYFGLLASRVGREPEAIIALEQAAQIEPQSSDPLYELGKLYEEREDWPKARQALEHAIELNPQYARAHYQLSRVYAHLGLTSKADQEAIQTRTLIDSQRSEAILKQRERMGSFQPQTIPTSSPQ